MLVRGGSRLFRSHNESVIKDVITLSGGKDTPAEKSQKTERSGLHGKGVYAPEERLGGAKSMDLKSMAANPKAIIAAFAAGVLVLTATQFIPPAVHNISYQQGFPYQELDFTLRHVMQALVSIILLVASLFVILAKKTYTAQDRHWAYGTVGTLVGFWLKGS